jgi:hypothetical protein
MFLDTFNGLGGWPLPALADDCALHATRTKGFLQSGQKTLERRLRSIYFPVFRFNTEKWIDFNPFFSALFKHQRLEALADTPALERDRIT